MIWFDLTSSQMRKTKRLLSVHPMDLDMEDYSTHSRRQSVQVLNLRVNSYCYKHPRLWVLRHYRHFSLFSSTSMKTEVSGMMENTTLTCTIIIAWTAGKVSTGSRVQVKQTHSVGFHFFLCISFSSFHKCTLLHICLLNSVACAYTILHS